MTSSFEIYNKDRKLVLVTDDRPTEELPKLRTRYQDLLLVRDALELVADNWPPKNTAVTLEPDQWVKLRRILLTVPDLVEELHS